MIPCCACPESFTSFKALKTHAHVAHGGLESEKWPTVVEVHGHRIEAWPRSHRIHLPGGGEVLGEAHTGERYTAEQIAAYAATAWRSGYSDDVHRASLGHDVSHIIVARTLGWRTPVSFWWTITRTAPVGVIPFEDSLVQTLERYANGGGYRKLLNAFVALGADPDALAGELRALLAQLRR